MRGVFNPDSPMMRALGVVWDLIVLNLLFLVCCIPVVTIGPAITALHYVTTKMAGEKDGTPVVGNFFKSFRANFRQGVLMGICFPAACKIQQYGFRYHTECVYHVCDLFAQNLFHVVVDRRMCSIDPVYTDHIALWIVFVVCAGVLFDRLCKCICFK